jgi:CRP-like cAMP-binding protein
MKQESAALNLIDKVLCLQKVDIFKHATTEMLGYIASIAHEIEAGKTQIIFSEEDVSDAMYVVVKGRVRLAKKEQEVMIATAGQSFGTWALFDNQPRVMTAQALENAQLLKIRSEDFYDLLSDHDEITPAIFRAVVERVKRLVAE